MNKKFLNDLARHFERTQALRHTTIMSASGWDAVVHDAAVTAGPMIYGYVWDQPTGWIGMCSYARQDFLDIARQAFGHKQQLTTDLRISLGHAINCFADGQELPEWNGLAKHDQLGLLLNAYAGTTQIWQVAGQLASGGHFVAMNYRKTGGAHLLRPFAIPDPSNQVLPASDLQERIREVLVMDRQRHPEWFMGGPQPK